ncbi:ribonuclease HII [Ichthyenterobacterium magnum]|uniref:Uncharacterized protein n=1 Tax=Ichthyenterobacterium magnum TaxID=1230530 RepID=A0A420DFL7_9FLAO|nr:ribonuclease HII [Ichthyenterobacterium magnum]RKE92020.1 hypothetical protein BXY80_2452 [Ichthyenterobacterium magnum]
MKQILFILISLILITSCEKNKSEASNIFNFIPENTSVILKSNSYPDVLSSIEDNSLISSISKYAKIDNLKQQLDYTKYISTTNDVLICLSEDKNDSLEFSLITKYHKSVFNLDSISNISVESFSTKKKSINKISINNQTLYSSIIDSVFFVSNRLAFVENAFNKKEKPKELEKIYNTANTSSSVSVLLNLNEANTNPSFFKNTNLNSTTFSNYILLDANIAQDAVLLNGITKATDSTKSLINVFKQTIPQENQISKVSPPDTDYLLSFTFNNFKTFNEQLLQFKKEDSIATVTNIFDNINEVGLIYKNNKKAIFLNSIDLTSTQDAINSQNSIETYRDVSIYSFDNPTIFKETFYPLISFDQASNFIAINDYLIFSNDLELLKDIISNTQNNTTLSESNAFKNMMLNLSDESSLFTYYNASSLNTIFNTNFSENISFNLKGYNASALQFIYDTDFAHINGIIKKHKKRASTNTVSEELNISLDNDLLEPQFLTNHKTKQKDIAVQDINNNLYLISNQGKVFWKKKLNGKILGDIEQVDFYKNGRLQLAFATPKRVYILDRNGKDVTPFPLKFNDAITQPLSVFDYDKKKKYRLLVTQGKSLLMYDSKGKIVKGFTYKKAANTITSQPKHFRIGKKDFIVFTQGTKLEILDRIGKTRVNVKEAINFSGNDIYLYKNRFTTTDTKGNLIQVNQKGQVSKSNLYLNDKHNISTTSKTLASLSDNKLSIRSKTIELDFGDYTAPKIFYLNDKIYVSTTDLQSKKIHLFDSQAKPIANFPIYGNSSIDLNNIDRDQSLELVTKGDSNTIIIYQIN